MLESLLTFLATHKTIIVGATMTVAEVSTIIINFIRKNRAESRKVHSLSDTPRASLTTRLFWAANPLNLFRRA